MPIIKNILRKGQATFQGLENIDVLKEERGSLVAGNLASEYFKISQVPAPIPTGKSYFRIAGSDLLKSEVELKTEIVDSENTPIYHFPLFRNPGDTDVRVAMEVYDDIKTGFGKIIILGELNPEKVNVPMEFRDIYNVKFIGTISLDTKIPNIEAIEFFKPPKITVVEDIRPNYEVTTGGSSLSQTISGSALYNPGDGVNVVIKGDVADDTDSEGNPLP